MVRALAPKLDTRPQTTDLNHAPGPLTSHVLQHYQKSIEEYRERVLRLQEQNDDLHELLE
jgi:hypothetical protein